MVGFSWEQQRHRADDLAARYPFAQDALGFFRRLITFQETMLEGLSVQTDHIPVEKDDPFPVRELFGEQHHDLLLAKFPGFLDVIRKIAPSALAEAAGTLRSVPAERWEELIDAYWFQDAGQPDPPDEAGAMDFFPKAFLQPYAVGLAHTMRGNGEEAGIDWKVAQGIGVCPMCGARAQASVLRPESHGASRTLLCSLCATEWRFKRVRCVSCGEEE
ncbi:MAG TPA: formate dehydrogenase accessory protein FdhE, partial [bacterium]|nr:formate dehydrogenase accessory protein FdhE [bacterium]